jgi:hypothetical protein
MLRALQPLELGEENELALEAELADMLCRAKTPLYWCECQYLQWFFKL